MITFALSLTGNSKLAGRIARLKLRLGLSLSDSTTVGSRAARSAKAGYCGLQSEKHLSLIHCEVDLVEGIRAGLVRVPEGHAISS